MREFCGRQRGGESDAHRKARGAQGRGHEGRGRLRRRGHEGRSAERGDCVTDAAVAVHVSAAERGGGVRAHIDVAEDFFELMAQLV